MKNILVTGSSGFLGTALSQRLENLGHNIIRLDKIQNGETTIIHDLSKPILSVKVDEIYNLAGTPSPAKYMNQKLQTFYTSTIGMINVLNLAVLCNAKVLQASTIEVYESTDWLEDRACYRYGKISSETLCYLYAHEFSLDIKIARMANSYGPGMNINDGRVIPEFIRKALAGEDISVFGTKASRSFCYVDDMIDVLILLMESNIKSYVNIYSPERVNILDLANKIVYYLNSRSKVIIKDSLKNDLEQEDPEGNNAEILLGWKPKIYFTSGLKKTINYFKEKEKDNVGKEN